MSTDTHVFIQYKNTDICFIVKCPHCGELWSMPAILPVKRTSEIEGEDECTDFAGVATGFVKTHQPVTPEYDGEEDRWKAAT